jgi:hypothetical protein
VPSTHPTEETEFGLSLLKTPTTMDVQVKSGKANPVSENSGTLAQEIMSEYPPTMKKIAMLPTPNSRDYKDAQTPEKYQARKELWSKKGINLQLSLPQLIKNQMLPTPMASDATTGAIIGKNDTFVQTKGLPRKINQNGTDGSVGLGRLVQMLPTPTARDYKGDRTLTNGQNITKKGELMGMSLEQTARILNGTPNLTSANSQLSPQFVMEMMGFPTDWTELPFLNGDKSQLKPVETQ